MAKTSDNVNLDFPARMADGRIFTDYRQNCIMNHELSQGKNSFDYRYFLEKNGQSIEQGIFQKLDEAVKCNSCNAQTVLPVQTIQNCNEGVCSISMNDPNGLGLDRGNTYQR
tara:strand:- start:604 stop:939 length:336 start_codon:yes stop_codon:yes gene_type:complete